MTIEAPTGSSGRIRYTNAVSTGDFTACGWFKNVTPDTGWDGYIAGGISSQYYGIWCANGSTTQLVLLTNGGQTNLATLTDDEWMFLALTHDDSEANEFSAYFRAEADTSLTSVANGQSSNVGAGDDLMFMTSQFGEAVAGDVGVIKIWDRLLTESELLLESQVVRPVHYDNLWAWLPCWSATDTTDGTNTGNMYDWSGNGNHGPLNSGNWTDIDDTLGNNIPLIPYGLDSQLATLVVAGSPPAGGTIRRHPLYGPLGAMLRF